MSLLPFLVAALAGAGMSLAVRGRPRASAVIGPVALLVALLLALGVRPGDELAFGGATLAVTAYLRVFLVLGCVVGGLLAVVGLAGGGRRDVPALMLGTLAAASVALALPDPRVAVVAATMAGLIGVVVGLPPADARSGATAGVRVLRATAIAGVLAVAATAWTTRPLGDVEAQPVVFGVAYLCLATGVAIRSGVIPFHLWAGRVTAIAPEVALPVVIGWGSAVFAIVGLMWVDGSVAVLAPDLGAERFVLVAVALVSVVLASVAATVADDLDHVLTYAIIADASVALLGLAALDPEAWAPTRIWIVAFVVARSALAGWVVAVRATHDTGRVADVRGWIRRSPPLVVIFGMVVLAGVGAPGLAAWEARSDLIGTVVAGPLQVIVVLATLLPVAWAARLLAVGLAQPAAGSTVEPWLPRWRPVDVTGIGTWAADLFVANRVALTMALALVLGLVALVTAAGGFGLSDAAAGLAPGFDAGPDIGPEG